MRTYNPSILLHTIQLTAINLLAIVLGQALFYISVISPTVIRIPTFIQDISAILLFGTGIMIAGLQWLFLRQLNVAIVGGGKTWVFGGVICSLISTLWLGFITLLLGDNPTRIAILYAAAMFPFGILIVLSSVQGLLLRGNKYPAKPVLGWVVSSWLLYGTVIVSLNFIWKMNLLWSFFVVLPLLIIGLLFLSYWFLRILEMKVLLA